MVLCVSENLVPLTFGSHIDQIKTPPPTQHLQTKLNIYNSEKIRKEGIWIMSITLIFVLRTLRLSSNFTEAGQRQIISLLSLGWT